MMNTGNTPQNDQNLPCGDLLENIEGYSKICVPLYHASIKGDWEAARVILEEHQQLDLLGFAITESYDTALHIASSVKSSKLTETFVENLVNKMTKDQLALQNKNYNTALSLAAAIGNTKIAVTMVEKNKALLDIPDSQGMMPLYTASLFGQSDMVNYLYDNSNRMTGHFWTDEKRSSVLLKCVEADMFDMITSLKDEDGNNMLHLVGKLPKINGLQLQRELMWFKEVKELMPPCYQESKNKDGLTPHELFMVEHKDLLSENKKLMKDMASQCLVVAALIAAIGFTLATTVPGGYDQKNGIPVFSQNPFFVAFTILDAISLIFSTTSILIFLSIFIYYRHEHEFLRNMPMIFAVGVATLNYSIGALLFGFSASFFLFYHGRFIWVPILISMMISIPLIHGCIRVQLLFFTQYDNPELREKRNRLLYQNPRV